MGGPCILTLAALIGMAVWFVALLRASFLSRGDRPLARHIGKLALRWGLWALVLLLVIVLSPRSFPGAGEATRRARCVNNLKQIGLAMYNYHDQYGCFPPAYTADEHGRPLHSWRVLLLPYLECEDLYDQLRLNEPWNSPYNQQVLKDSDVPSVFRCPSAVDDE